MEFLKGLSLGHYFYYLCEWSSAFVQEANITVYADDTSLDKAFPTSQELKEEMIPAFSKVRKWLRNNKLSLNTVKTEFMIIGTLQRLDQLDSSPETNLYAIRLMDRM